MAKKTLAGVAAEPLETEISVDELLELLIQALGSAPGTKDAAEAVRTATIALLNEVQGGRQDAVQVATELLVALEDGGRPLQANLVDIRQALQDAAQTPLYPLGDSEEYFGEVLGDNRFDKDSFEWLAIGPYAKWKRIPSGPFEGKLGVRVFLWIVDEDGNEVFRPLDTKEARETHIEAKHSEEVANLLESLAPGFLKNPDGSWREFVWVPKTAVWMDLCTMRSFRSGVVMANLHTVWDGRLTRKAVDDATSELSWIKKYNDDPTKRGREIAYRLFVAPLAAIGYEFESFFDGVPRYGLGSIKAKSGRHIIWDFMLQIAALTSSDPDELNEACDRLKKKLLDHMRTIADMRELGILLEKSRVDDPTAARVVIEGAPGLVVNGALVPFEAVDGELTHNDIDAAVKAGLWQHLSEADRREKLRRLRMAADQNAVSELRRAAHLGTPGWNDTARLDLGGGWLDREAERVALATAVGDALIAELSQVVTAKELARRRSLLLPTVMNTLYKKVAARYDLYKEWLSLKISDEGLKAGLGVFGGFGARVRGASFGIFDKLDFSDYDIAGLGIPPTLPLVYAILGVFIAYNHLGGGWWVAALGVAGALLGGAVAAFGEFIWRRRLGKSGGTAPHVLTTLFLVVGVFLVVTQVCNLVTVAPGGGGGSWRDKPGGTTP